MAALLAPAGFWGMLHVAYPFLAVTAAVRGPVLVVDGWLPTSTLAEAAAEYRRGRYRRLVLTRAVYGFEALNHDDGNMAVLRQVMMRFGVSENQIVALPFPGARRDRTAAAAAAVGAWLADHPSFRGGLDVYTLGPHARRSRLVYQRALPGVSIGVIAGEDPSYDPAHWWRFSDGIREVPFEGLAYLYVRL